MRHHYGSRQAQPHTGSLGRHRGSRADFHYPHGGSGRPPPRIYRRKRAFGEQSGRVGEGGYWV